MNFLKIPSWNFELDLAKIYGQNLTKSQSLE